MINFALPDVRVDISSTSTLCVVVVNGKDKEAFCGIWSRAEAVACARDIETAIFDAEDERRRKLGRVKVSRPNAGDRFQIRQVA